MLELVFTLLCMPVLETKLDKFLVPINMAVLTHVRKSSFPEKTSDKIANPRYLSLYNMLMQAEPMHTTINPLLSLTRTN